MRNIQLCALNQLQQQIERPLVDLSFDGVSFRLVGGNLKTHSRNYTLDVYSESLFDRI